MEVTDSTFQKEVIEKSKEMPVIVDFWASWCGPCKAMAPILEKISEEMKDKVSILKLNTEENPVSSQEYEIMSIPCLKLFKNAEVADEHIGLASEETIKSWIESNL